MGTRAPVWDSSGRFWTLRRHATGEYIVQFGGHGRLDQVAVFESGSASYSRLGRRLTGDLVVQIDDSYGRRVGRFHGAYVSECLSRDDTALRAVGVLEVGMDPPILVLLDVTLYAFETYQSTIQLLQEEAS